MLIRPAKRPALALGAASALIMAACGPAELPDPTGSAAAPASAERADTLSIGVHLPPELALGDAGSEIPSDLPLFSLDPNGTNAAGPLPRLVFSGVYRLDASHAPVPDLAAEPCSVSDDLLLVTCRLREALFHDGTPVTADDVAFTYQLLMSDACRLPACEGGERVLDRLESVLAIDARTVEFRLGEPDVTLLTELLPEILVEPRALVDQAFDRFSEESRGADAVALEAGASELREALAGVDADSATCADALAPGLERARLLAAGLGLALRNSDDYVRVVDGDQAACAFAEYVARVLNDAADALRLTGTDAIAAAYRILDLPELPVGSGPWRVRSIDPGLGMSLEAHDEFHRGRPATPNIEVRLIGTRPEAAEAIRSGAIEWLIEPFAAGTDWVVDGVGDAAGVVLSEYHEFFFWGLHYNMRPGRLFADKNLRVAMELCIDKEETVAAATGGNGVPIYSSIGPGLWAFEPDLPRAVRDVDAARGLIEASGWRLGDDGVYQRGEERLAATVPVVAGFPDLLRFAELLAVQVADCGIEIVPVEASFEEFGGALTWPFLFSGAEEPTEAWLFGWFTSSDPDATAIFHADEIASETYPDGFNVMGYLSPEGDALLERARATPDTRERARLYREHQRILAEDRPILFAFTPLLHEARSSRLASTAGALETTTLNWWWELETLFVLSSGS